MMQALMKAVLKTIRAEALDNNYRRCQTFVLFGRVGPCVKTIPKSSRA